MRQLKPKTCRQCKGEYQPRTSLQVVCTPTCAIDQLNAKKEKRDKAEAKARKKQERISVMTRKNAIKPRAKWLGEAQAEFNKYIRARDIKEPCISCQRHHSGQYHAGHYLSRGAFPELSFNEDNCHKQCQPCNNHLSGNIAAYRINLVKKIGVDRVEKLEGPHNPLRLDIEQIKELKAEYKAKTKLLISAT